MTLAVTSKGLCQEERVMAPWFRFSWLKTAKGMRSVDVLSAKTPIGLVRRRTSRNRRSVALRNQPRLALT